MVRSVGCRRVVGVDWSGDKGPGQRRKIWAGVWTASSGKAGKGDAGGWKDAGGVDGVAGGDEPRDSADGGGV